MDIRSAIEILRNLPKGYISKKIIKGKTYYYLQCFENGKITSKYIKTGELEKIKEEIKKRKEIEAFVKANKKEKDFILSKRAKELTGYLMSGDNIAAKFLTGHLIYINKDIAPLYIIKTGNIDTFLENRTLDLSRANARILLKQLGILDKEKYIALYSYGATIYDNYWFKPLHSSKKYNDISFNNDVYSSIALEGKIFQLKGLGSRTPEFTNIGSFEKCWRLINNKWWLYKKGNNDEIFSEYFVYKLASNLNLNVARYELEGDYIRTLNFADKYNFESIYSLAGDNEDYNFVFKIFLDINKEIAKDYIKLLWFDAIVYNVDRHNQNYGLMRDKKNGKIISLAPNFDNNLALIAYNKTLDQNPYDEQLLNLFIKFIGNNKEALKLYKTIKFPIINDSVLEKTFKEVPNRKEKDKIKDFILSRYKCIKEKLT